MKDENNIRNDHPAFDYEEDGEENKESKENEENSEQNEEPEEHRGGVKLLTYIQIFSCLAILAAALVLRILGSDLYQTVRTWYLTSVNNSIIAEEQMDEAKRTVIGFWNNISSAGPQVTGSSQAAKSSAAQNSSNSQNVSSASTSQTASSQMAQSASSVSSSAGKSTDNNQQVSP